MRDPFGLVPPEIRAMAENDEVIERETREKGVAIFIDKALKEHDPHLSLVKVKDGVDEWDLPPGCIPGRWHVRRLNPGFIPTFWPIVGPNGEYREPTHTILEEMRARDLHREDTMRALRERQSREGAAKQRGDDLRAEQRRDELAADLRAGKRLAGDGGLTKGKWGRG
jgi:hypothetical protein